VNVVPQSNRTALMLACVNGHNPSVKALLDAGAGVNEQDAVHIPQ
jgi:ankyrin repeat protein